MHTSVFLATPNINASWSTLSNFGTILLSENFGEFVSSTEATFNMFFELGDCFMISPNLRCQIDRPLHLNLFPVPHSRGDK